MPGAVHGPVSDVDVRGGGGVGHGRLPQVEDHALVVDTVGDGAVGPGHGLGRRPSGPPDPFHGDVDVVHPPAQHGVAAFAPAEHARGRRRVDDPPGLVELARGELPAEDGAVERLSPAEVRHLERHVPDVAVARPARSTGPARRRRLSGAGAATTCQRWPNGSTRTALRPYSLSATGRSRAAPSSTALPTTASTSTTSRWRVTPLPAPGRGAVWPISGNSSASIISAPPKSSSAWPMRPSGITIGSIRGRAPKASAYQSSARAAPATARYGVMVMRDAVRGGRRGSRLGDELGLQRRNGHVDSFRECQRLLQAGA